MDSEAQQIAINDWILCLQSNQLLRAGASVQLENRQSQLLEYLARRAGVVISKEELLQQVWRGRVVSEDALYVCVANLRKALGDEPKSPAYIKTVAGLGYKLMAAVSVVDEHSVERSSTCSDIPTASPVISTFLNKRVYVIAAITFVAVAIFWCYQRVEIVQLEQLPVTIADDYRQARYFMTPEVARYNEGVALLEGVIKAAPSFSGGYANLGESKFYAALYDDGRGTRAEAEFLVNKALALNPDDDAAHFTRALIAFIFDWDFEVAQRHFLQALNHNGAELFYAQFLVAIGEFELAEEHIRHYVSENPKQYSLISVAWVYAMNRNYEKAEAAISPLALISPDDFYFRVSRQFINQLRGREVEATEDLLWLMSHAGYAQALVDRLRRDAETKGIQSIYRWLAFDDTQHLDIGQYTAPFSQARYALAAGDHFEALQRLEESVAERQEEVLWIMADPAFDALRDYPKFQQLVEAIGLDQFNYLAKAQ